MPRKTVGAERWAAIRALAEGHLPTYGRLAAAADLHISAITARCARGSWNKVDCRDPAVILAYEIAQAVKRTTEGNTLPAAERVVKAAFEITGAVNRLEMPGSVPPQAEADTAGETETLPPEAVRDRLLEFLPRQLTRMIALAERGIVDRPTLDAMLAMVRFAERAVALLEERKNEEEKKSDEEFAALHAKLDDRIVELAEGYARRVLAGERPGPLG